MTRSLAWLLAGVVAMGALLAYARYKGARAGQAEAELRTLTAAIDSGKAALARQRAQLARDSVARVAAEDAARIARQRAAAERARADSLGALVRILDDSTAVLAARDTVRLPPLVIAEITQLRATVLVQAEALRADTVAIARLTAELATARRIDSTGADVIRRLDVKVERLGDRGPWYARLARRLVPAVAAAGCGAIGAVVAGPAGAAIGAGGCALVTP